MLKNVAEQSQSRNHGNLANLINERKSHYVDQITIAQLAWTVFWHCGTLYNVVNW